MESVSRLLAEHADPQYRSFMAKLIPTVDPATIVGVRTPALRKMAKDLGRSPQARSFLQELPHATFEENQLHAFIISAERDYDCAIELCNRFLPHVDNWATCDQMSIPALAKRPDETLEHVESWLGSGRCYTIRFGIGVLMKYFLDERFSPTLARKVAESRMPRAPERPEPESDAYYVNMMRAWYFAEALVKQEESTLPYLERTGADAPLDEWTRRKAIQKALESRRVPADLKTHLRTLR